MLQSADGDSDVDHVTMSSDWNFEEDMNANNSSNSAKIKE
jgi:hypothetical protein